LNSFTSFSVQFTASFYRSYLSLYTALSTLLFHRRYHYVMQPWAFGDIYCFPVPVAIRADENLLQAKLAETSLLFSKFYNSSTNTFEISI